MGQTIASLSRQDADASVAAEVDQGDSIEAGIQTCDVAIDFSTAAAINEICKLALKHKRPLVIGTTGHSAAQKESIRSTASSIPIVFASNFSAGVNVLFWLSGKAVKLLGEDFHPEIVETHHQMKKDAPSGTAKTLAEIIKTEKGGDEEIPVRSIREGEVVGEHTVILSGPGERLELMHKASSRETFASGALAAAKWVVDKPPGLYSMQDVLGLG
jgi:4-hydroxy-tetrahydrodipicolinate reductase